MVYDDNLEEKTYTSVCLLVFFLVSLSTRSCFIDDKIRPSVRGSRSVFGGLVMRGDLHVGLTFGRHTFIQRRLGVKSAIFFFFSKTHYSVVSRVGEHETRAAEAQGMNSHGKCAFDGHSYYCSGAGGVRPLGGPNWFSDHTYLKRNRDFFLSLSRRLSFCLTPTFLQTESRST